MAERKSARAQLIHKAQTSLGGSTVAFTANRASLDVMSAVANRSPVSIPSASCTRVAEVPAAILR